MKKYKITQKQNMFYVYKRFLFIFWIYQDLFCSLYNAEQYIKFETTPEINV